MSDVDAEIYRLRDLLDTIPSEWKDMNVVELDGYVAALIVCPATIPPSEWLPGVWGSHIGFEDAEGTEATIAAVMGHYSRIARELAESPEDYAPVLGVDADRGESLWEPWIGGFERGMRLRRAVWRQIARSDDREAATSLNLIIALSESCRGRSDLTEEDEEKLRGQTPELIPEFVDNLCAWWKSRQDGEGNGDPRFGCGDRGGVAAVAPHALARDIADRLLERGVGLALGTTVYDPGDPMGKMFFNILATFAEFESDLIRMRTREGMAIARAKGKLRGRQPKLSGRQASELRRMHGTGDYSIGDLAAVFSVSRPTVYRTLRRTPVAA